MITDYRIISAHSLPKLEKAVCEVLHEEVQPYGFPFCVEGTYIQVMITEAPAAKRCTCGTVTISSASPIPYPPPPSDHFLYDYTPPPRPFRDDPPSGRPPTSYPPYTHTPPAGSPCFIGTAAEATSK